ncbi:hypothetical protein PIROE2DRAFT_11792, partial [Piromyces sp. E2]
DISLDKGDENENILDNADLNLPDIESFDFTIDNTNKLDDGVDDDDDSDNENKEDQDADKKVNISMDDVSINEDKSENFDNEISNIQADDNDEVPIISAVEPNENEQTSWSSVIHDEFKDKEKDSMFFKETAKAKNLTRKEAVNFFFEVLSMTTKNMLRVEQNEAYGDIKITPKDTLFNKA